MALGDIVLYSGQPVAVKCNVASGAAASIKAGDLVEHEVGSVTVELADTNQPDVTGDKLQGVAASTSTDTAAAAGTVDVFQLRAEDVYLISPNSAAAWDTQAEYDALVGKRVLMDLTGGAWTILASDSANNGCVIQPLDIKKYPGKVAFSFRAACNYLA